MNLHFDFFLVSCRTDNISKNIADSILTLEKFQEIEKNVNEELGKGKQRSEKGLYDVKDTNFDCIYKENSENQFSNKYKKCDPTIQQENPNDIFNKKKNFFEANSDCTVGNILKNCSFNNESKKNSFGTEEDKNNNIENSFNDKIIKNKLTFSKGNGFTESDSKKSKIFDHIPRVIKSDLSSTKDFYNDSEIINNDTHSKKSQILTNFPRKLNVFLENGRYIDDSAEISNISKKRKMKANKQFKNIADENFNGFGIKRKKIENLQNNSRGLKSRHKNNEGSELNYNLNQINDYDKISGYDEIEDSHKSEEMNKSFNSTQKLKRKKLTEFEDTEEDQQGKQKNQDEKTNEEDENSTFIDDEQISEDNEEEKSMQDQEDYNSYNKNNHNSNDNSENTRNSISSSKTTDGAKSQQETKSGKKREKEEDDSSNGSEIILDSKEKSKEDKGGRFKLKPLKYANKRKFDEKNCFVCSFSINRQKIKEFLLNQDAEILYFHSKWSNSVSFCVKSKESADNIQKFPYFDKIEKDSIFTTAAVQLNIPEHIFNLSIYQNTILNNYLLNNFYVRILGLRALYKYFYGYYNRTFTGKGVNITVLDTSVDESHPEIKGRVKNAFANNLSCDLHGTLTCILLGGSVSGIAKDSTIRVLNVVDCDGKAYLSNILYALDFYSFDAAPAVLYFGFAGHKSEILNAVIDRIARKNVIVVTPAGNNRDIGCSYSPGSASSAINVGSLDTLGNISAFSNFNSCIRLYALGENYILGNHKGESDGKEARGTSLSAAIVAGAVATALENKRQANLEDIWTFLLNNSVMRNGFLSFTLPENYTIKDSSKMLVGPRTQSCWQHIVFWIVLVIFLLILILLLRKTYSEYKKEEPREHKIQDKNEHNHSFYESESF